LRGLAASPARLPMECREINEGGMLDDAGTGDAPKALPTPQNDNAGTAVAAIRLPPPMPMRRTNSGRVAAPTEWSLETGNAKTATAIRPGANRHQKEKPQP